MFAYAGLMITNSGGDPLNGDGAHGPIDILTTGGNLATFASALEGSLENRMTDWIRELKGYGRIYDTLPVMNAEEAAQLVRYNQAVANGSLQADLDVYYAQYADAVAVRDSLQAE